MMSAVYLNKILIFLFSVIVVVHCLVEGKFNRLFVGLSDLNYNSAWKI